MNLWRGCKEEVLVERVRGNIAINGDFDAAVLRIRSGYGLFVWL
jgi:hypothetical protein